MEIKNYLYVYAKSLIYVCLWRKSMYFPVIKNFLNRLRFYLKKRGKQTNKPGLPQQILKE